jgi:AcrR family transcriptional regulator
MTKAPRAKRVGEYAPLRIGDRNRTRILDAAVEVFAAKGFEGARIAEIAERSGLAKANVYYYFATKEAIYETLIQDLVAEWDVAVRWLDDAYAPDEALAGYVRAKLEFSRKRMTQSKMFANEVVHGGRFLSRSVRRHMRDITIEKAKVFERWAEAGLMDPVDPKHLFILLWGVTQYYADFNLMATNALGTRRLAREDFATAAATITHVVLKGCGVRARATPASI